MADIGERLHWLNDIAVGPKLNEEWKPRTQHMKWKHN